VTVAVGASRKLDENTCAIGLPLTIRMVNNMRRGPRYGMPRYGIQTDATSSTRAKGMLGKNRPGPPGVVAV
jgi:hypothetical protein